MGKRGLLKKLFNKKGQVWETLIPWIIAIAVIVLVFILFFVLKGKGVGAIEYFRDLWRFR